MKVLSLLVLMFFLGIAAIAYQRAMASYNPEDVCATKHKHIPREKCLSQIYFAQSAGM